MGRPLKAPEERLSERLVAKVTPEEAEGVERRLPMLHTEAARATVAGYLRMLIRKDLAEHGCLSGQPATAPPYPAQPAPSLRAAECTEQGYDTAPNTEEPPAPLERFTVREDQPREEPAPAGKPRRSRR